ncbi:MAG: Dam family site-specific DNA-(adenine-N6)-methyltransferase [Ignavibacteria bacterium]|nr:Dam family site-specific DNA-(adenine-N6)-methyltransferase [Ignavibacteria bacterium]
MNQSNAKTVGGQSFLRWAGSKKQLLPVLSSYYDMSCDRYVEPFAGSACLFFSVQPRRALLGDINSELILTYRELKYRLPQLLNELQLMRKNRSEYYKVRALDPKLLSSSRRAARFIYLNRFCFNGLYRTNGNGNFNVPYGGDKSGNIPSRETLSACSKLLRNARLVPGDFERVLTQVRSGDFVYMDPPFSVKSRRVFNEYDASIFRLTDVQRLRIWMEKLDDIKIPFLVSYAESAEAKFLRRGFHSKVVEVKRNIAGFIGSRSYSKEIIISNVLPNC